MEPSPAVTARLEAEFTKLVRHYPEIVSGRVTVAALHRHQVHGHHYQIHLDVRIPGHEIVVSHEPAVRQALCNAAAGSDAKRLELDAPHRDLYVVVRDAFDVVRRRLDDAIRAGRPGHSGKANANGPGSLEP